MRCGIPDGAAGHLRTITMTKTKGSKRSSVDRCPGNQEDDTNDDEEVIDDTAFTNEEESGRLPTPVSGKNQDFAARRAAQRQAAADQRTAKWRCHICGQAGHLRRECPGIADDGRGESKYTQSKGDPGARQVNSTTRRQTKTKTGGNGSARGHRGSGRKRSPEEIMLVLPDGFAPYNNDEEDDTNQDEPFLFYDTGCDSSSCLEYLRTARKLSSVEAELEYQRAIDTARKSSNFGGLITRVLMEPDLPFTVPVEHEEMTHVWYTVGLHREFLYNDSNDESMVAVLLETARLERKVVGFFSDLDYSSDPLGSRPGCDRECQLRRLRCTCLAAGEADIAIQIRTTPSSSAAAALSSESNHHAPADVMADVEAVLHEVTTQYPDVRIHLSCWFGTADVMNRLITKYPRNVWIGLDGAVTFAKAHHAHECAFDVPLSRLILDSGTTIPAIVAKTLGRDAFCHSGLIPFLAEAVARYKPDVALAVTVARAASTNALALYPRIANPTTDAACDEPLIESGAN